MADPIHAFEADGAPSPGAAIALDLKADKAVTDALAAQADTLAAQIAALTGRVAVSSWANESGQSIPDNSEVRGTGWTETVASPHVTYSAGVFTLAAGTWIATGAMALTDSADLVVQRVRFRLGSALLGAAFGGQDQGTRPLTLAFNATEGQEFAVDFYQNCTPDAALTLRTGGYVNLTLIRIA